MNLTLRRRSRELANTIWTPRRRAPHPRRLVELWFTIISLGIGVTVGPASALAETPATPRNAPHTTISNARLIIPSIGLDKEIVQGWTREINQGKVTLIGDCWPEDPRTNWLPCSTVWIAGHHTAHGAPFRNLPSVPIGAIVTITHNSSIRKYVIVSKIRTPRGNPPLSVFFKDLLLQCSDGKWNAWVLSGRLISTSG